MLLPQNGRIIILDDKESQALPLIRVLSKNKLSHTYHSGNYEFLPDEPYEDVRILFLDLNLTDGTDVIQNIKSQLISLLTRILTPGSNYILAIWSINETELLPDVLSLFENELNEYKPILHVPLKKGDFFKPDGENGFIENDSIDTVEELNKRIAERFQAIDSYEVLIKWENLINTSASQVIKDITDLTESAPDKNKKLKDIYYKLAEAQWGRQIHGADAAAIAEKASTVFNELLSDKLEINFVENLKYEFITKFEVPSELTEEEKGVFNSKLLLSFDPAVRLYPGNVYENSGDEISTYPFSGLIADSLNITLVTENFYIKEKGGAKPDTIKDAYEFKNANNKAYKAYEKEIRDDIKNKSKFISLEISPMCDYAQKKWKSNRICPGVLWESSKLDLINKSENLYVSPIVQITGVQYAMVLDLRYFTSVSLDRFKDLKPLFRLKHPFLVDIQSLLSRHINRPGISSIN